MSRRPKCEDNKYKTVLCNNWHQTGRCPYGRKCRFAHGPHELRRVAVAVTRSDGSDCSDGSDTPKSAPFPPEAADYDEIARDIRAELARWDWHA